MIHGYVVIEKRNGSAGPQYPVKKSLKIGRGTNCDIRIHVQSVSEQHCQISVEKGKRALLQNLSASSHTGVNGVSIGKGIHELNHGDSVRVGERSFQWYYGPHTPFFECKTISVQRRRRSEADSAIGSQNVAVVNPLFHKRKTLGAAISLSDTTRSPKVSLKPGTPADLKKRAAKASGDSVSPTSSKCPVAKTSSARASVGRTPRTSVSTAETPKLKTPAARASAARSPAVKSRATKSPIKSPALKSIKSPIAKSSKVESLASKTAAGRKTPAKTGSQRKCKSAVKSLPKTKGLKRRLSSPAPVSAKRLKIESPKSIDKKKMAVLMGIHGKSRASTLSTVKVVLSGKKTPVIKSIKTPRSSTVKKGSVVKSSIKKAWRPLFSDILKKKAVKKANTVSKKLALVPRPAPKAKKVQQNALILEVPQQFKFGSTGHANSPETIFISRKTAKTPVVTKKGRKDPMLITRHKENINLSGVHEMFQTPSKLGSGLLAEATSSRSSASSSRMSRLSGIISDSAEALPVAESLSMSPKGALSSSFQVKITPVGSTMPLKTPTFDKVKSSGRSSSRSAPHAKLSGSSRASTLSAPEEELISKTRRSTSKSESYSKKPLLMLTSTPAAFGKRQSNAETAFESPSSLLTGQNSAPQSPASGRKSRFEMVPKVSYVHSPHASPVKSSLKSSPSRSPPSGGHGKSLSVSFDDSIRIQMLVPGSRKSLNTTAPLCSPASPRSEGHSGTATPDLTTFDFNSIKTPNVPREMFVSSIFSSGASSSSQALGSAKRKGKAQQNDVTNLHGVRRLMKTPSSPTGYVDVKGVKRLMTAACKTPTYLAVEGVKKLFGDAAAAAGNELSSFAGVRELFASPSPSKTKATRFSLKEPSKATPRKSSPVAKIQAEVESKGRSTVSTPKAIRKSSPPNSPARVEESKEPSSKNSAASPSTRSNSMPGAASIGKITREKSSKQLSPKLESESSPFHSVEVLDEKVLPKRGSAGGKIAQPAASSSDHHVVPVSPKLDTPKKELTKGRLKKKVSAPTIPVPKSPSVESPKKELTKGRLKKKVSAPTIPVPKSPSVESPKKELTKGRLKKKVSAPTIPVPKSPSVESPPKRLTRRAACAVSTPLQNSAEQELPKSRARRGAAKASNKEEKSALPEKSPTKSPVKVRSKRTTRKTTTTVLKTPSPVKSPPTKRTTRRAAKTTTVSSPKTKAGKRAISPSEERLDLPAKKSKMETPAKPSPEKAVAKKTKTEASPKPQNKRKAVTFNDDVITPQKRGKMAASKNACSPSTSDHAERSEVVSPVAKRTKRVTASKKMQQGAKGGSPIKKTKAPKKTTSPVLAVSPRRTRSRK